MGNLLTEVALLAWYQPTGFHRRMLSALQHLDQVQSLCSPCCADKSEQSSHHSSISLLHSDLLLPFLASTQGCSHTVHRPNINQQHAYYFILISLSPTYSWAQPTNCCVQICDTVTNMAIIYMSIQPNIFELPPPIWCLFNLYPTNHFKSAQWGDDSPITYCKWKASFAKSAGLTIPTAVWYINRLICKY